ncbi:MAG TPA: tetratricopeptide repeat protein [Archangium sp.]|uniref:tetratricopeptide repeat protein n=1 Tax=Archangium sp. TaxID=1872627 RepID=UPI002E344E16|nr:tetratricopeptide repeat protein [Archangium sp.]HEX5747268.1 tetratricopeptide repeat protein [Archangium sp.]
MMTLTPPSIRPSFANDPFLQSRLNGLGLLSSVMMLTGFSGIVMLLGPGSLADASEVDLGVTRVPLPIALAGVFFVGLALRHWLGWRVRQLERRGWELLQAGRPEAAIRSLEVAMSTGSHIARGRGYYALALACFRQGDYERALALGEKTTWLGRRRDARVCDAQVPALMAVILALYGELDDAREWVGRIRRPMFDETDHALLAQAVMLCREGRYVEAVKRIQRTARKDVPETDVDAVAVLHAFARSRLGGQLVPLKPQCVQPQRPARGSESQYEYLACEWPELAAFLRGEEAPAPMLDA